MTKDQIQSLIANYLSKQAEEGPGHEAAETPSAEELEHAMGVGGEEHPHGDGPGGVDVEQLLSQLSPEELQELISQLSAGGHPTEGAPDHGGDDVAGLSQDIESHLAQNPEAQVPGAEPEKAAALDFVKSAHYIEGFIKQALDYGLDVDQAVGMYDNALTTTVDAMKKEAGIGDAFRGAKNYIAGKASTAGKYVTDKSKAVGKSITDKSRAVGKAVSDKANSAAKYVGDKAKDIRAGAKKRYEDAALSAGTHPGRTAAVALGAAGTAAGAGYLAGKSSNNEKEAAYFEGMFKQALAYGFSEDEAAAIVKDAANKGLYDKGKQLARIAGKKTMRAASKATAGAKDYIGKKTEGAKNYVSNKAEGAKNYISKKTEGVRRGAASAAAGAQEHLRSNKATYTGIGAGAAGLAIGHAAGKSSDKEKKAAYLEGVFKRAMDYGFSEEEAVQFAQQAEANL